MVLAKYQDYKKYKEQLDEELNRSAESFVRIGYLLKVARDTDVLEESGYASVVDFAKAEYGIDKTQVSRFISINDKFSEDGYSEKLLPQYQGFGYSKLTLMLAIPAAVAEELTPTMSKADIKAVKDEVDAERQTTDIEVMIEEVPEEVEKIETKLGKVLKVLAEQDPDMIRRVKKKLENTEENFTIDALKFEFAPDEEKMYSIRVPGIGRIMAMMKHSSGITLTEVRSGSKTWNDWEELLEEVKNLEIEEIEEIAPVQPTKSKVVKFTPPMPEPIEEEEPAPPAENVSEDEIEVEEISEEEDGTEEVDLAEGETPGDAERETDTTGEDSDRGHTEGDRGETETAPRELKWPEYARKACHDLDKSVGYSKWEQALQDLEKLKHYITRAIEEEKRVYQENDTEETI